MCLYVVISLFESYGAIDVAEGFIFKIFPSVYFITSS